MSKQRLTAADRVRNEIDGLFADPGRELGEILEEVARLSVRLVMQSALEAEVTKFLVRERYSRGERARVGHRNGYSPVTVKTTAGPIELQRPKGRGTLEAFASPRLGKHVTRTNALESRRGRYSRLTGSPRGSASGLRRRAPRGCYSSCGD